MKTRSTTLFLALGLVGFFAGCGGHTEPQPLPESAFNRMSNYTTVPLTAPLEDLSEGERKMIGLFIDAAREMDAVFWRQATGEPQAVLSGVSDPDIRQYIEVNYGPWDRLNGDEPFLPGVKPKPLGAQFYPADMSKQEFEKAAAKDPSLSSLYTLVRRNGEGVLKAVPYSEAFSEWHLRASEKLRQAAELAEDPGLKHYLELRAQALLDDQYQRSDLAWMDMKDNRLDLVIGPIETYEDQLFGYKAAHTAFILVKDMDWSSRLARYTTLLPDLQTGLPVAPEYRQETPGEASDLNAYDLVYCAGDCNAGGKSIAINLPNDEEVQLQKGTRRLQLKNALRAKFDRIMVPLAAVLIDPAQRDQVTFDAFFGNVMFHEVAHGLGIKNTINGKGTVREALREQYTALEENKADVLGLHMVSELLKQGVLEGSMESHSVTFLASVFRSIRFGATSAHGRANLSRFNYFLEQGAFIRDENGYYRVDFEKMKGAVSSLSDKILRLQGDGDYEGVQRFMEEYGQLSPDLKSDLARLAGARIPIDIVYEQGPDVLGLR